MKKTTRQQFERWYKRTEEYRNTVRGLREAFEFDGQYYFYQSVHSAWSAFLAGSKLTRGARGS